MTTENNEQKETEKAKGKDEEPKDNNSGVQSEATDLVKRASQEREGLARENERLEKNLKELRELAARDILGGQTEAGVKKQEKELSPQEYSKSALEGRLNLDK